MALRSHLFLLVAVAAGACTAFAEPTSKQLLYGITLPADGKARELKFEQQGTIRDVKVKPGQPVKAGDILAQQDDRKEQAELKGLIADASEIEVQKARTAADEKTAAFKRIAKMHDEEHQGNDAEYDEAKAAKQYAIQDITAKEHDLEVKKSKVEHEKVVIDMMKLRSPVEGYVQSVDTHAGEIADPQKPVITVVANDPLQVSVDADTSISQKLKLGQSMRVSYDGKEWYTGTVSFIAPQATGVGLQKIWIQLPNSEQKRDSGLKVKVQVPDDIASAVAAEAAVVSK
jgi:RND family efflux transporter MFP subunit